MVHVIVLQLCPFLIAVPPPPPPGHRSRSAIYTHNYDRRPKQTNVLYVIMTSGLVEVILDENEKEEAARYIDHVDDEYDESFFINVMHVFTDFCLKITLIVLHSIVHTKC